VVCFGNLRGCIPCIGVRARGLFAQQQTQKSEKKHSLLF